MHRLPVVDGFANHHAIDHHVAPDRPGTSDASASPLLHRRMEASLLLDLHLGGLHPSEKGPGEAPVGQDSHRANHEALIVMSFLGHEMSVLPSGESQGKLAVREKAKRRPQLPHRLLSCRARVRP